MQTNKTKKVRLTDLLRLFPTEKQCIDYLIKERWPDLKPRCIYCGTKAYKTKHGFKCAQKRSICGKTFTIRTGTIYENSPIPLPVWFQAIYHSTRSLGIHAGNLSHELNLRQATAYSMLKRIRKLFTQRLPRIMEDIISIDELYEGGLEKWKREEKRIKGNKGRSLKTKVPVIAFYHWSGFVMLLKIPDVKIETIKPLILKHIKKGSIIVTDQLQSYKWISKAGYNHIAVNHSKGEMSRGAFHNNFPEMVFKFFRRFKKTFINIDPEQLQEYLNWFAFLFNYKNEDKCMVALSQSAKLINTPTKPAKVKPINNKVRKAA